MDLNTFKIEGLYRGCCKFCLFCLISLLEGLRVGGIWRVGFCKHFITSSPMKKQRSCFHQKGQLTFKRGCRFHEDLFDVFPPCGCLSTPLPTKFRENFQGPFEVTLLGGIK